MNYEATGGALSLVLLSALVVYLLLMLKKPKGDGKKGRGNSTVI
jgi:hypothetical protein